MPVSEIVQQKIVQLASNDSIDVKTKLAVRKRFYELKQNEIDLEAAENTFVETVKAYESQIDEILNSVQAIAPVVEPVVNSVVEPGSKEEVFTPTAKTGIRVRMQEEFEDQAEDVTQEVPVEMNK